MVTEKIAKSVFSKTREHYESGLKSGNKKYDVNAAPWYKTLFGAAQNRTTAQPDAWDEVQKFRKAYYDANMNPKLPQYQLGQMHYSANHPAANCGELAEVASYLAIMEGLSPDVIRIAYLSPPGDHGFCMIGHGPDLDNLNGRRVHELETCPRANIFVIDAWTNICVEYRWYPSHFATKMKKWLAEGKRVHWQGTWHEPYRPYAKAFLESQLNMARVD